MSCICGDNLKAPWTCCPEVIFPMPYTFYIPSFVWTLIYIHNSKYNFVLFQSSWNLMFPFHQVYAASPCILAVFPATTAVTEVQSLNHSVRQPKCIIFYGKVSVWRHHFFIWYEIILYLIYLIEISFFVKMSEKVVAPYGKLSFSITSCRARIIYTNTFGKISLQYLFFLLRPTLFMTSSVFVGPPKNQLNFY